VWVSEGEWRKGEGGVCVHKENNAGTQEGKKRERERNKMCDVTAEGRASSESEGAKGGNASLDPNVGVNKANVVHDVTLQRRQLDVHDKVGGVAGGTQ